MAKFMKQFYEQRKRKVIEDYYMEALETEKFRAQEKIAATIIQKVIKSSKLRKTFQKLKKSTIAIQRIYRGWRARVRFSELIENKHQQERYELYSGHARTIQRIYRGFYSRKYVHDFYARRKYLAHIETKGEQMRQRLQSFYQGQLEEDNKRVNNLARTEFDLLMSKLHYLTSTKVMPGVYQHVEGKNGMGSTQFLLKSRKVI